MLTWWTEIHSSGFEWRSLSWRFIELFSWIKYDKKSRKKALDYTSGYLELKECGKQFLTDSSKAHIDIFQSNPEFNRRVTHILQPRKLTVVVIGGISSRGAYYVNNGNAWKLASETQFEKIGELLMKGPSICYYDWNKLILTGGWMPYWRLCNVRYINKEMEKDEEP